MISIAVPGISRLFDIDFLTSLVISPLLLITLSAATHLLCNATAKLFSSSNNFENTQVVVLVIWLVFSFATLYKELTRQDFRLIKSNSLKELFLLFPVVVSMVIWTGAFGQKLAVPSDNDALSNAFIFRRFANFADHQLCMIPGDVTFPLNLRFESCGSGVLARFSNLFGLVPLEQTLNSSFLLISIFLPLGAMASWKSFGGLNHYKWIAGLTSITFLMYPYALNGLLRLSLGLAFVLPILGLFSRPRNLSVRQVILLSICLVALGFIHLLPLVLVIIYFAFSLIFESLFLSIQAKSNTAVIHQFVLLSARTLFVVAPSFLLFGLQPITRNSISNVLEATSVPGLNPLSAPIDLEFSKIARGIFLGNSWTRPQPILLLLALIGLYLLIKRDIQRSLPLLIVTLWLYSSFLAVEVFDFNPPLFHLVFINNWYRLAAVLSVVAILPTAFGVYEVMKVGRFRNSSLVTFFLFLVLLVSCATGWSIVRSAWSRPSLVSEQLLAQFDQLESFANTRTLNFPLDGSSWAYARSGIEIVAPNDRAADLRYGEALLKLANPDTSRSVCPLLVNEQIRGVLAVGSTKVAFDRMVSAKIIDSIKYQSKDVSFGLISDSFLKSCRE